MPYEHDEPRNHKFPKSQDCERLVREEEKQAALPEPAGSRLAGLRHADPRGNAF
ncbi:hypothetical protein JL100_030660 (plasmid) [Skermanella mucosa]|uniref:hypothetical protein n=1 Tax=Skermanella mucosa TaxID=1789672 RepID=UPI00192C8EC2|nr:hypothetical protein [Skermanella mucosa]UEM24577.1 hypothetical protein JL100_030660 [Skermanella mucosa]